VCFTGGSITTNWAVEHPNAAQRLVRKAIQVAALRVTLFRNGFLGLGKGTGRDFEHFQIRANALAP